MKRKYLMILFNMFIIILYIFPRKFMSGHLRERVTSEDNVGERCITQRKEESDGGFGIVHH